MNVVYLFGWDKRTVCWVKSCTVTMMPITKIPDCSEWHPIQLHDLLLFIDMGKNLIIMLTVNWPLLDPYNELWFYRQKKINTQSITYYVHIKKSSSLDTKLLDAVVGDDILLEEPTGTFPCTSQYRSGHFRPVQASTGQYKPVQASIVVGKAGLRVDIQLDASATSPLHATEFSTLDL